MNLKSLKLAPVWITIAVLAVVWFIQYLPRKWPGLDLFQRLEWITFDWRARQAVHHSPAVVPNLGFVFIDDDSIGIVADGTLGYQYGLYWPRQLYGSVVQELHAQGAKLIAFDVLFGELRADHSPLVLPGSKIVGSDAYFAQQMHAAGNVVLAASKGVIPPLLFKTNAWVLGHIDATADSDGVLRRAKAYAEYRDWHDLVHQFARANGADLSKAVIQSGKITLQLADGTKFDLPVDKNNRFDLYQIVDKPNSNAPPVMEKAFVDRRVWHTGIVLAARQLQLDLNHPVFDDDR
ncbi:MAG: CHASE2 domain-containing protein, partial [Pedosphaera parvula]|nr:CHASE2 domain-containing protein [Pedosphaera parvula]